MENMARHTKFGNFSATTTHRLESILSTRWWVVMYLSVNNSWIGCLGGGDVFCIQTIVRRRKIAHLFCPRPRGGVGLFWFFSFVWWSALYTIRFEIDLIWGRCWIDNVCWDVSLSFDHHLSWTGLGLVGVGNSTKMSHNMEMRRSVSRKSSTKLRS